tara:strand:+ start:393 stop:617 length:225 start_codon:yes stop_codon:yes gene_type:complete
MKLNSVLGSLIALSGFLIPVKANPYLPQNNPYSKYQNPYSEYQNPYSKYQNPYSEYQNPYSDKYIMKCQDTGGC